MIWASLLLCSKALLGSFSLFFLDHPIIKLLTKRIMLNFSFKAFRSEIRFHTNPWVILSQFWTSQPWGKRGKRMLNNNPSPDSVADISDAGSCMLTKQQPLTSSPFYKKPDQGLPLFDLLAFFTSSSAAMTSLSLRNSPAAFATFRLVQNTINSICWHSSSSSLSFLQQDNKYWSSKQHTNILQYQYLINTVPFSNFLQTIVVIFQT